MIELPARALAGCPQGTFVSAARADGLRVWYAYGFRPKTSIAVTVDGQGQHYAFRVGTDAYGVYTGTRRHPDARGALRAPGNSGHRRAC